MSYAPDRHPRSNTRRFLKPKITPFLSGKATHPSLRFNLPESFFNPIYAALSATSCNRELSVTEMSQPATIPALSWMMIQLGSILNWKIVLYPERETVKVHMGRQLAHGFIYIYYDA